MDKKGFITIKIIIFVSLLLSVFLVFSSHLKFRLKINDLKRQQRIQLESNMANFDTLLFKDYGLYGLLESDGRGLYRSNVSNSNTSVEVVSKHDLSDPKVVENQIIDFMAIRMPANYIEQLMVKLEMVIESGETNKSLEILNQVYDILKDFDDLLKEVVVMIFTINSFKPENELAILEDYEIQWQNYLQDYKAYDEAILHSDELVHDLFTAYEAFRLWYLEQEKPSEIDHRHLEEKYMALSQAQSENESLRSEQLAYEVRGKNIIQQLATYKEKIKALIGLHDQVLDIIEVLKVKEETLKVEMGKASEEIHNSKGLPQVIELLDTELMTIKNKVETNKITKEDYERLAEAVSANKGLLNQLLISFETDYNSAFEHGQLYDRDTKTILYKYDNTFETIGSQDTYTPDPENELIYKGALEKTEAVYEPETSGRVIEKKIPLQVVSGQSNFWSVMALKEKIEQMYESLMVNEYLLGTLKTGALSSKTEMDFFNKYQRPSFFARGELEYILFGKASEKKNLAKTWTGIYGVRVIMNGIHVYLDKDKLLLSESIGLGVAGWTGFLAPIVTQVVRLAWAMGESAYDIKVLLEGDSLPFLKVFSSEWHLDLGLKITEKRKSPKLSHFTYHDYLRFFLMTMDTDLKIKRFQNILVLNFYDLGHVYDLNLYKTDFISSGLIKYQQTHYKSTIELGY